MNAPYTVFRGQYVVRGYSPDGDSLRFVPERRELLGRLHGWQRLKLDPDDGSVSVRLEGMDAPELHFGATRQRRGGLARDSLLRWLGFRELRFIGDYVEAAQPATVVGGIASTSVDVNGRLIAFAFRDADAPPHDAIALDRAQVRTSANAAVLAGGHAYHLAYTTLASSLRDELRSVAASARRQRRGLWAYDATREFAFNGLSSINERGALIFPKLFRRCVSFWQETAGVLRDRFAIWLRRGAEDDRVVVAGRRRRLSELVRERDGVVSFAADPMNLVFVPRS